MSGIQRIPTPEQHRRSCLQAARALLHGRTITDVRYMTDEENNEMMWTGHPLVLVLDNGTIIYPSCDNEGNNAGTFMGVGGPQAALPNTPFRLSTF